MSRKECTQSQKPSRKDGQPLENFNFPTIPIPPALDENSSQLDVMHHAKVPKLECFRPSMPGMRWDFPVLFETLEPALSWRHENSMLQPPPPARRAPLAYCSLLQMKTTPIEPASKAKVKVIKSCWGEQMKTKVERNKDNRNLCRPQRANVSFLFEEKTLRNTWKHVFPYFSLPTQLCRVGGRAKKSRIPVPTYVYFFLKKICTVKHQLSPECNVAGIEHYKAWRNAGGEGKCRVPKLTNGRQTKGFKARTPLTKTWETKKLPVNKKTNGKRLKKNNLRKEGAETNPS